MLSFEFLRKVNKLHDAYADDMTLAEGIERFEQAVDYQVTRIERSWGGLRFLGSFVGVGSEDCGVVLMSVFRIKVRDCDRPAPRGTSA